MEISKIKAAQIQSIINFHAITPHPQTGKPYSKRTLKGLKDTVNSIFKLAIENRVINFNPASSVKLPNTAEPMKRRAISETERQMIIETPHRARRAAMIMLFSGLRRGELIPLTWNDVDFEEKTIIVNKSVEMISGKAVTKQGAKSKSGQRTVYIPQILVDFLKNEKRDSLLVCPSANGKLMSSTAWKCMWESYILELNLKYGDFSDCVETGGKTPEKSSPFKIPMMIEGFTAHNLRHTFITMMYFAGIDVLTAKEQAGHADIKTIMEIYTHLDSDFKKKSMGKLDDFLSSSDFNWVSGGVSDIS
ncbi:MAG: site-specific integrase [Oscillospiraceae bacterium]|nr:site-specific integrase [Oscillospiraceae bacterium]